MRRANESRVDQTAPPLALTSEGMAWLGVALLLGVVGWWKSINLVLLVAYVMLGLLLANGLLARAHARRVRATRETGPPVYAGEAAGVRVVVANEGTRRATALVEDRAAGEPVGWLVNRLPPGASAVCEGRREFPSRGRYRAPVRVASAFPLGLLQYERPDAAEADVVVLPAPGSADPDGLRRWVLRHVGGDGRARKVLRRVTTEQSDVRGVRPYRPGDPIRAIHWRSSARRHELMVREYDTAPSPDLVLVVEPWLPENSAPADRAALEEALSLAVTVARAWNRAYGSRVVVAVAGDGGSVRASGGSEESLRAALAPLAGVAGAAAHAPLAARVFDRTLGRAARVVVSSRPNSPYADALGAATGRRFFALSPADDLPWYQPPAGPRRPDPDARVSDGRVVLLTPAARRSPDDRPAG